MKKMLFFMLTSTFLLLCSCKPDNTIKMGYDESKSPPILEVNLDKSPQDNVKDYIAKSGVDVKSIKITSADAKGCGCAKFGKSCLCKLSNKGLEGKGCGMAKTKCKKLKMIKVKVDPADVDALAGIGFAKLEK